MIAFLPALGDDGQGLFFMRYHAYGEITCSILKFDVEIVYDYKRFHYLATLDK